MSAIKNIKIIAKIPIVKKLSLIFLPLKAPGLFFKYRRSCHIKNIVINITNNECQNTIVFTFVTIHDAIPIVVENAKF